LWKSLPNTGAGGRQFHDRPPVAGPDMTQPEIGMTLIVLTNKRQPMRTWWKEAVIYQVYPHSFKDGDGDGIGDLQGILSKLDYIAGLGVDTLWLNPVFGSPGEDNGYDISDYKNIQPEMGTMEDMEGLIRSLHDRGMRIIIDMVVNHTSDEHPWFRKARQSRSDPHYLFYHWWPAEKGQPPFRAGFFDQAGQGWQYNETTNSYYLHYFSPKQPDLNWDNPGLREQIYEMLEFWIGKGIDGFRLDAITYISKDPAFPEITPGILKDKYQDDWGNCYADGPRLHEFLHELNSRIANGRNIVLIGEGSGVSSGQALLFVGEDRHELDILCHFEGIMIGYLPGKYKKVDPAGYKVTDLKEVYTRWEEAVRHKGWNSIYLGNHDQPRMLSRWGDDSDCYREASAKLLFTFLLTMPATPFLYNGDEIGMTNIRFDKIEEYKDIETRRVYQRLLDTGGDAAGFLKDQQLTARDNSRTPFQWDNGMNAGFSTADPWMRVNDNYMKVNVAAQEADPGSILHFVRQLIRLRKNRPVFVYGDYRLVDPRHPHVYAFIRRLDPFAVLTVLNFSKEPTAFTAPFQALQEKDLLIGNYPGIHFDKRDRIVLQPYQAAIFEVVA
jgi:oligo-1,6-glucosidase